MSPSPTPADLPGVWNADITFVEGPRQGETEPVVLTFLAGGVILHADEMVPDTGRRPRGIGEWTSQRERLSYWFNVVLSDPAGKPTSVGHIRATGTVGQNPHTFEATGTGEIYTNGGDPLVTHRTTVRATRAAAP